jgi:hypothetical protein
MMISLLCFKKETKGYKFTLSPDIQLDAGPGALITDQERIVTF